MSKFALFCSAIFALGMSCVAQAAPMSDPTVPGDLIMPVALKPTLDANRVVLTSDLWALYRQKFITDEGRVVDDGNEGVSHSEGQGYGMLLAAFADDQETFRRLWTWTAKELYIRGDNLAAWRWRGNDSPHVQDKNNATDGDLLIAWALAEAGTRWKNPEYRTNAHRIAIDIGRNASYSTPQGRMLSPGAAGFSAKDMKDGPVVNASYWVFPAMDALKGIAPEVDWTSIKQAGLKVIRTASQNPAHLPPNWISVTPEAGIAPAKDFPPVFGYDAIRIPLYLAWGSTVDRELLSSFNEAWRNVKNGQPNVVDVTSGATTQTFAESGYQAIVALTRCATEGTKFPAELMNVKPDHYYPSTLHMLALVVAGHRYSKCF